MPIKLYRMNNAIAVEYRNQWYQIDESWDQFINQDSLFEYSQKAISQVNPREPFSTHGLAPVESQPVWASGVTYYRSREARMEESEESGGARFYDLVYDAPRPELFFKCMPKQVVGSQGVVTIRQDSHWNVPEPELTLFINSGGKLSGFTIGNDMSSRDIEGENPLYLPQAKVWKGSCALGPCLFVPESTSNFSDSIALEVIRDGEMVVDVHTHTDQIKRSFSELIQYLFYANEFDQGVYLMTGTGIVPESNFSLLPQDEIRITIPSIGSLVNQVALAGD